MPVDGMPVDATGVLEGRDPDTLGAVRVGIVDGCIAAVEPIPDRADLPWIAPGLVDLQVNGFAGHDLNAAGLTPATVSALARAMLAVGVTRFLPTLITGAEADILASLRAIAAARDGDPVVRLMVPAIHVEGPNISDHDGPRGAHPRDAVRPWDLAEFDRWQGVCGGLVGMVTLSPHADAAMPYIAALRARGVHVAIGHSHATPEQIHAAAQAGAILSTHLGNGVSGMLPRHPNLLWAQLADDRLSASFIADGHHLDADTLKAMIRAKGLERAILVSDTVALGGLAPGVYDTPVGGQVELAADGRLSLMGTPFLAGAALPLIAGVARAMRDAGLTLAQALRLATANPARFVGERAALAVGLRADLMRFHWAPGDDTLTLHDCWLAGQAASTL